MDHIGLDVFGQINLKSEVEKTRIFFVIESEDKDNCSDCQIDIVISADNLKTKSIIYVN